MEFGELIASGPLRAGGAVAVSPPVLEAALVGREPVYRPGVWLITGEVRVYRTLTVDGVETDSFVIPAPGGQSIRIVERAATASWVEKQESNAMRSRIAQAPVVSVAPAILSAEPGATPEFSDGFASPGRVRQRTWYLGGSEFAYGAAPIIPAWATGRILGLRVTWEHDDLLAEADAQPVMVNDIGAWSITDNGDGTFDVHGAPVPSQALSVTDNGDGTFDIAA